MSPKGALVTNHVLTVNVNYSDSSTASATIAFDSVSETTPSTTVGQTFACQRDGARLHLHAYFYLRVYTSVSF